MRKNLSVVGSEGVLGKALCFALEEKYGMRRVDKNCPNEANTLRADVRGAFLGAPIVINPSNMDIINH